MHKECLGRETENGIALLSRNPWIAQWYLAGGTAAALHYGHRKSFDLDFFSEKKFSVPALRGDIESQGACVLTSEEEFTLTGVWQKIKISFMRYPYRLLEAPVLWNGIRVASVTDLALMKLDAIAARGTRRDFIDLFWICKASGKSLEDYIRLTGKKFGKGYSKEHLFKSLSYFKDAEREPSPKMLKHLAWEEVRSFFTFHALRLAKKTFL